MKQFYVRWEEKIPPDLEWAAVYGVEEESEARKLYQELTSPGRSNIARNVEMLPYLTMNPAKYRCLYWLRFWWWGRHQPTDGRLDYCYCGYSWPCPWKDR